MFSKDIEEIDPSKRTESGCLFYSITLDDATIGSMLVAIVDHLYSTERDVGICAEVVGRRETMMVSARDQVIETERLRLEPFAPAHSAGLNALDRDPEVMRFIGNGTTRSFEETEASIKRVQALWEKLGYSWWAIFSRESNELIGAACLQHLANKDGAPLEIGWRLRPSDRGKGFATEAGRGVIKFAFEQIGASYLVAVAHPENRPSHRVMERLGMTYVGIQDHYDRRCVVYELRRSEASAAEA